MAAIKPSPWTIVSRPNPDAGVRLFCFPYAGSGASVFRDWPALLPRQMELVAVQLPGRENRFQDPRHTSLEDVVGRLLEVFVERSDKPFVFFGHSLGALIAFELTRRLQAERLPGPFHLVVSGMKAPQLPREDEPMHLLDDDRFLQRLADFNGTPRALLQDAELMSLFIPLLRDDFAMCETYRHLDGAPVRCPLTALGGDADADVAPSDLAAWSAMASSDFECHIFPGDHFYLHPNRARLAQLLGSIGRRELLRLANGRATNGTARDALARVDAPAAVGGVTDRLATFAADA